MFRFENEKFDSVLRKKDISRKELAYRLDLETKFGEQKISRWVNNKRSIKEFELEALENVLGVRRSEFGDDDREGGMANGNELQSHVLTIDDLNRLYASLEKGWIVSIVSSDGFLEAGNSELRSTMRSLAERGIVIQYFYPRSSLSIEDFRRLRTEYRKELDGEAFDRIKGYQVGTREDRFIGWSTRFLVLSRLVESGGAEIETVQDVYVYVWSGPSSASSAVGSTPTNLWVRLNSVAAKIYYTDLWKNAEDIPNIGIYVNDLESNLQNAYRFNFAGAAGADTYRSVQSYISAESHVTDFLNSEIQHHVKKTIPHEDGNYLDNIFRYLDIGAGDGRFTMVIDKQLQQWEYNVQTVAVEPSPKTHSILSDDLIHYPICFEDFFVPTFGYDLITSIHSFYLIDTSYLSKVYELLKRHGLFAAIISPREKNIINSFCQVIDTHLINRQNIRLNNQQYFDENRLRNYGEDIYDEALKIFSENHVTKRVIKNSTIKYDTLFKGDGSEFELNPEGWDILKFLTLDMVDEVNLGQIDADLKMQLQNDPNFRPGQPLPCDTWIVTISKATHWKESSEARQKKIR